MNKPERPQVAVEQPAAWLVTWDGVTGTAGRAFVKRENAEEFVARCCYPDNRAIAPLYDRPQHLLCANRVLVERVARHLEQAVQFIESVYRDSKTLDRGPILSNLRRWARLLRDALEWDADAEPAARRPLSQSTSSPAIEVFQIVRSGRSVQVIDREGRTTGPLNMGECLEQVIGLLFADARKVYPMRSVEEWIEHGVTPPPAMPQRAGNA